MLMLKIIVLSFFLLSFTACVEMRDYTGVRDGAFGLDIKKGFDQGKDKKDYCLFDDGSFVVLGDKKTEVTQNIGLPDKVESTFEGYESWTYKERKVKLIFDQERLKGWEFLN